MLEKFLGFLKKYIIPKPLFRLAQPVYHYLLAFFGNLLYGAPSKKLLVVGITGTKGKTTVLELMNAMFEVARKRTALLSSVRMKIGSRDEKNPYPTTMPGRFAIQRFLYRAVKEKCEIILIEVTSEGVSKHRHRFIDWDAAVFLNLHPEHVEAHGSFEAYREAKLSFFSYLKHSKKPKKYFVISSDDPNASYFERVAESVPKSEIRFFSYEEVKSLVQDIREKYKPDWLTADFNILNVAAARALVKLFGIKDEAVEKAIINFKGLRGRMDFVQKTPFAVVVDYAHTPDSLRAVYKTLRGQRLICVLGSAGGGRDKWKRPELGRIAAENCNEIFFTSEDPYDENPAGIINAIEAGFSQIPNSKFQISKNYWKIIDRKEALKKAISLAKPGDVVVTTGMGSQDWFYGPQGTKIPWDEHKIVEEILSTKT